MTKQQALDQLRDMQAWHEDFGNGPCPDYDAICYAINIIEAQPAELETLIKALEQEHKKLREMQKAQPEPCEDAVSRKDCLQALSHLMDVDGFRDGWAVSRANVECMLKAMPPVTPKQRTGYWYPVGMAEAVGGESAQWGSAVAYHKYSECDEQALRDDFEQEVLSDFCPHCGAKMVGQRLRS